jgi:hypothetical protein
MAVDENTIKEGKQVIETVIIYFIFLVQRSCQRFHGTKK